MMDDIKRYFDLLEQLVTEEHKQEQLDDKKLFQRSMLQLIFRAIIYTSAITFLLLTILIYVFKFIFLTSVLNANMISLFIVLLAYLSLNYFSKSSGLSVPFWFAKVDAKYLPLLTALPSQTLKLGRLELEHGRDWFVKGLGCLIGFIDKVGLIPSILSLSALWAIPEKIPDWGLPIIVACIFAYGAALLLLPRCRRFDRMIALTELALKIKNEDNKD